MLKYYRLTLIIAFSLVLVLLVVRGNSAAEEQGAGSTTPSQLPTLSPTPTATPTPTVPLTVHLSIPKLGVETAVDPVGTDEQGAMVLPQESDRVGWFEGGFRPGSNGNAVIGGHLDQVTGAPAVFYSLGQLSEGDLIMATDEQGTIRTFEVTSLTSYPYQEVPLHSVFGESEEIILNLITCSGTFLTNEHTYSHRLVVTAISTQSH